MTRAHDCAHVVSGKYANVIMYLLISLQIHRSLAWPSPREFHLPIQPSPIFFPSVAEHTYTAIPSLHPRQANVSQITQYPPDTTLHPVPASVSQVSLN